MKFLLLFSLFIFPLLRSAPMIPIMNLNADSNIKDGLGFTLLDSTQKSINFTLTSYSKLNPSAWMTITYPPTKTYANISIPISNIEDCELDFEPKGQGVYEFSFKVKSNDNDIDVDFNSKSNDNDISQFKGQFNQICRRNLILLAKIE